VLPTVVKVVVAPLSMAFHPGGRDAAQSHARVPGVWLRRSCLRTNYSVSACVNVCVRACVVQAGADQQPRYVCICGGTR